MIQFIVPVIIFGVKGLAYHFVSEAINQVINERILQVRLEEVEHEIKKSILLSLIKKRILSSLIYIFINVILLLFAVYLVPLVFNKEVAIYIVCSVYLGSIISALYSFIKSFSLIKIYIFDCKLNLKEYIKDELHREIDPRASKRINKLGFFERLLYDIGGESVPQITNTIVNRVIERVIAIAIKLIITFAAYVIIFRFIVAPTLVEDATQLNSFQAVLYPLLYSVDYFFNTTFISWI